MPVPAARATLLGLTLWLAACTTTIPPGTAPPANPAGAEYVEREGARRSSVVSTRTSSLVAHRSSLDESRLLVLSESGDTVRLPLTDVRSIQFTSAGHGARDGAGFGFLAALAVGVVLGNVDPDTLSRVEAVGLVTAFFAVATVPIGAAIGALIGHRTRIVIDPGFD